MVNVESSSYFPPDQGYGPVSQSLQFPFKQNTIARKARSPGVNELSYQFANRPQTSQPPPEIPSPVPESEGLSSRRTSGESDGGLSIGGEARQLVAEQVEHEAAIGEEEERAEIDRAGDETGVEAPFNLATPVNRNAVLPQQGKSQSEENVAAALREGSDEEVVEDRMAPNATERKQLRREKLAEKLQEVFGLEEREPVLEEMRCWLLRSVSEWIDVFARRLP